MSEEFMSKMNCVKCIDSFLFIGFKKDKKDKKKEEKEVVFVWVKI